MIESQLLEIYTEILLTNNKLLLSNIVSNKKIILSKYDLEKIIEAQTGSQCEVILCPQEANCISRLSPFDKIDSIKIINKGSVVDYKHTYNKEYNELLDHYSLCLNLVCG